MRIRKHFLIMALAGVASLPAQSADQQRIQVHGHRGARGA